MSSRERHRGFALLFCLTAAIAGKDAFSEDPAPKEKHWGGSLVDFILHLPEVTKWKEYEKSLDPKAEMTAWGEGIGQVDGHDCSYIGLGLNQDQKVKVLKHFCVSDFGELWIQKAAAPGSDDGPTYVHYDAWLSECKPTSDSYGQC